MKNRAYPNYDSYMSIGPKYDTKKWIDAVKDIYYKTRTGLDKQSAVSATIGAWDDVEQQNFFNWLRFYEEGTHLKYKYAQSWYEGVQPGYFLPVRKDQEEDKNEVKDLDERSAVEKKKIIEHQRKKVIGRLDSAEKLLRSDEGLLFAGKELEMLLEIIYQLKKKIQLINKKSASTKLYSDIIVREANILTKKGFSEAADLLYKLADEAIPTTPSPAPPTQMSGLPTTVPGTQADAGSPPSNPSPDMITSQEPEEPVSNGMKGFLDGLKGGTITDELDVLDTEDLVVEAQDAAEPKAPIEPEIPSKQLEVEAPASSDENLEVVDKAPSQFDSIMDSALKNLTIEDVVFKLEDLAKIFKTREIPRQLAIVDMMLDTLGLASFFPSLAEATNKSLESNQYVLTRVEDILSKLRGTLKSRDVDLMSEHSQASNPQIEIAKSHLTDQEEKDKAKKQMRKDLENKSLEEKVKEVPEIEIEEDLGQPVQAPSPPIAQSPEPSAAPSAAPVPTK